MATEQGLPKSNHPQEGAISQAEFAPAEPMDRRRIPADATESHWQAVDGHSIRRIDWPGASDAADGQPRGSILFLPGRGDFYEKYLETLDQWHRAGWRVTASDWRGQGASGRLGADAVTGHVSDFSVWTRDLGALWSHWKAATPGPHVLAGHSMGGHLALRAVIDEWIDPDALVLVAPMLGFTGQVLPLPMMHGIARLMAGFGDPRRPAWKWSEKPGEVPAGRDRLLTHDPIRYDDELYWRDARPELVMGPGSWHWVERAYASMRHIFEDRNLEHVSVPALLIGTSNDRLVYMKAIERAARRLPRGELLAFGEEASHEILREVDPVRDRAMAAISEFLDRVAPAR